MLKVESCEKTQQKRIISHKFFKTGELISLVNTSHKTDKVDYQTMQWDKNNHVHLDPDKLKFINHSCAPNSFFDLRAGKLIALQDINYEQEITCFYPATEWDMNRPFVCNCENSNCLGWIFGARQISRATLSRYKLSKFIYEQVEKNHCATNNFFGPEYLQEYFSDINQEFDNLYNFWLDAAKKLPPNSHALELGVGPTLYSAFPIINYVEKLDLADYILECFEETNKYLAGVTNSFDWSPYITHTLKLDNKNYDSDSLLNFSSLVRKKINKRLFCDLLSPNIINKNYHYDLVTAHYCTEAACNNITQWAEIIKNITNLIKPQGHLLLSITTNLTKFRTYGSQARNNTAPDLSLEIIKNILREHKLDNNLFLKQIPAPPERPYKSTILVHSQKKS